MMDTPFGGEAVTLFQDNENSRDSMWCDSSLAGAQADVEMLDEEEADLEESEAGDEVPRMPVGPVDVATCRSLLHDKKNGPSFWAQQSFYAEGEVPVIVPQSTTSTDSSEETDPVKVKRVQVRSFLPSMSRVDPENPSKEHDIVHDDCLLSDQEAAYNNSCLVTVWLQATLDYLKRVRNLNTGEEEVQAQQASLADSDVDTGFTLERVHTDPRIRTEYKKQAVLRKAIQASQMFTIGTQRGKHIKVQTSLQNNADAHAAAEFCRTNSKLMAMMLLHAPLVAYHIMGVAKESEVQTYEWFEMSFNRFLDTYVLGITEAQKKKILDHVLGFMRPINVSEFMVMMSDYVNLKVANYTRLDDVTQSLLKLRPDDFCSHAFREPRFEDIQTGLAFASDSLVHLLKPYRAKSWRLMLENWLLPRYPMAVTRFSTAMQRMAAELHSTFQNWATGGNPQLYVNFRMLKDAARAVFDGAAVTVNLFPQVDTNFLHLMKPTNRTENRTMDILYAPCGAGKSVGWRESVISGLMDFTKFNLSKTAVTWPVIFIAVPVLQLYESLQPAWESAIHIHLSRLIESGELGEETRDVYGFFQFVGYSRVKLLLDTASQVAALEGEDASADQIEQLRELNELREGKKATIVFSTWHSLPQTIAAFGEGKKFTRRAFVFLDEVTLGVSMLMDNGNSVAPGFDSLQRMLGQSPNASDQVRRFWKKDNSVLDSTLLNGIFNPNVVKGGTAARDLNFINSWELMMKQLCDIKLSEGSEFMIKSIGFGCASHGSTCRVPREVNRNVYGDVDEFEMITPALARAIAGTHAPRSRRGGGGMSINVHVGLMTGPRDRSGKSKEGKIYVMKGMTETGTLEYLTALTTMGKTAAPANHQNENVAYVMDQASRTVFVIFTSKERARKITSAGSIMMETAMMRERQYPGDMAEGGSVPVVRGMHLNTVVPVMSTNFSAGVKDRHTVAEEHYTMATLGIFGATHDPKDPKNPVNFSRNTSFVATSAMGYGVNIIPQDELHMAKDNDLDEAYDSVRAKLATGNDVQDLASMSLRSADMAKMTDELLEEARAKLYECLWSAKNTPEAKRKCRTITVIDMPAITQVCNTGAIVQFVSRARNGDGVILLAPTTVPHHSLMIQIERMAGAPEIRYFCEKNPERLSIDEHMQIRQMFSTGAERFRRNAEELAHLASTIANQQEEEQEQDGTQTGTGDNNNNNVVMMADVDEETESTDTLIGGAVREFHDERHATMGKEFLERCAASNNMFDLSLNPQAVRRFVTEMEEGMMDETEDQLELLNRSKKLRLQNSKAVVASEMARTSSQHLEWIKCLMSSGLFNKEDVVSGILGILYHTNYQLTVENQNIHAGVPKTDDPLEAERARVEYFLGMTADIVYSLETEHHRGILRSTFLANLPAVRHVVKIVQSQTVLHRWGALNIMFRMHLGSDVADKVIRRAQNGRMKMELRTMVRGLRPANDGDENPLRDPRFASDFLEKLLQGRVDTVLQQLFQASNSTDDQTCFLNMLWLDSMHTKRKAESTGVAPSSIQVNQAYRLSRMLLFRLAINYVQTKSVAAIADGRPVVLQIDTLISTMCLSFLTSILESGNMFKFKIKLGTELYSTLELLSTTEAHEHDNLVSIACPVPCATRGKLVNRPMGMLALLVNIVRRQAQRVQEETPSNKSLDSIRNSVLLRRLKDVCEKNLGLKIDSKRNELKIMKCVPVSMPPSVVKENLFFPAVPDSVREAYMRDTQSVKFTQMGFQGWLEQIRVKAQIVTDNDEPVTPTALRSLDTFRVKGGEQFQRFVILNDPEVSQSTAIIALMRRTKGGNFGTENYSIDDSEETYCGVLNRLTKDIDNGCRKTIQSLQKRGHSQGPSSLTAPPTVTLTEGTVNHEQELLADQSVEEHADVLRQMLFGDNQEFVRGKHEIHERFMK